nr:MAG TPA: hypothetical protein [Caudoviricetes sp.]
MSVTIFTHNELYGACSAPIFNILYIIICLLLLLYYTIIFVYFRYLYISHNKIYHKFKINVTGDIAPKPHHL